MYHAPRYRNHQRCDFREERHLGRGGIMHLLASRICLNSRSSCVRNRIRDIVYQAAPTYGVFGQNSLSGIIEHQSSFYEYTTDTILDHKYCFTGP